MLVFKNLGCHSLTEEQVTHESSPKGAGTSSMATNDDNDLDVECRPIELLLQFKEQVRKTARPYYASNRASCGGANILSLSETLLCNFSKLYSLMFGSSCVQAAIYLPIGFSGFRDTSPDTIFTINVTQDWIYHFISTIVPSHSNGKQLVSVVTVGDASVVLLRKYLQYCSADSQSPFRDVRQLQLLATQQTGCGYDGEAMARFAREMEHLISKHMVVSSRRSWSSRGEMERTIKLVSH